MEGLPREIIRYISKFLRPEDANAFRKTSKFYNECLPRMFLKDENNNRIFLYAQRAIYERRYCAVEYFFEMLSRQKHQQLKSFYLLIIEADDVTSLCCFKKYFLQQFGWMNNLQICATELNSEIWRLTLASVDTFTRLSSCFEGLTDTADKKCHIEKLKILYQYTNPEFFKWAFAKDKSSIAVAIIDELQYVDAFEDFSCSAKCSKELQRLYCSYYHGGYMHDDTIDNLVSFISLTTHVHPDACLFLYKKDRHDAISAYCTCEKSLIEININKRAMEPPSKRIKQ